jgi:hypothetical protein
MFFFENGYFQFFHSFDYSNKYTLSTYKNTQPWFCKKKETETMKGSFDPEELN